MGSLRRWSTRVALSLAAALLGLGLHGLAACATDRPLPNLALPTAGGQQLWADVAWRRGWRVQEHVWTGHGRLLDPCDVRRGWGSLDACTERLDELVPAADSGAPVVVLLHGLWRTRDSMGELADALELRGAEVIDFGYPSTRRTIEEHAAQLAALLDRLEGADREVSFVTHSLGALVLRATLAREGDPWRDAHRLGRAVLIAAPNGGAALARFGARIPGALMIYGKPSRQIANGAAEDLRTLPLPFMTVAGARGTDEGWNPLVPGDDDGIVGVDETRLEGARDTLEVDAIHTLIMKHPDVVERTVAFLRDSG